MMMRAKGFTLRDLVGIVVLVFILAALARVLVPGISRSIELADQANCQSRLMDIGKAIAMYKSEENERFPLLWTSGRPEANITPTDPAETIEELKTKLIGREAAMENVWLLIDKGFIAEEDFQCPSDEDYRRREFADPADRKANRVGWQSPANFSYGLHFPYESTTVDGQAVENPAPLTSELEGSFVIMADRNPSLNNEPATGVGANKAPSSHEGVESYLSYLMFNGGVSYKASIDISSVNGDNIYTIEPRNNANQATPADIHDQYIIRHPALSKEE